MDDTTDVVDNSARYADALTKVIDDAMAKGMTDSAAVFDLRSRLEQQTSVSEDCLNDTQPRGVNSVVLGPMVPGTGANGETGERATFAALCAREHFRGLNRVNGYKASVHVDGMQSGDHRGHLCAAQFACPGNARDNLTPLTAAANVQGMYHDFERCVAEQLDKSGGEKIFVAVVPVHTTDSLRPDGVAVVAAGNRGYQRSLYIPNTSTYNKGNRGYCE